MYKIQRYTSVSWVSKEIKGPIDLRVMTVLINIELGWDSIAPALITTLILLILKASQTVCGCLGSRYCRSDCWHFPDLNQTMLRLPNH